MTKLNSGIVALLLATFALSACASAKGTTCGEHITAQTPNDFRRDLIGLRADIRALQVGAMDRSTADLDAAVSVIRQNVIVVVSYRDRVPARYCEKFLLTVSDIQESVQRLGAAAQEANWDRIVAESDQLLEVLSEAKDYLPRRWTQSPRMGGSRHSAVR